MISSKLPETSYHVYTQKRAHKLADLIL